MSLAFDAFIVLFVFSCAYMVFRVGIYWAVAAAVAAITIQQLIRFWMSQSGIWSYAVFFAGTMAASAVIVVLFMLYFNVISKYKWIMLVNRVCGSIVGLLLGLLFLSMIMMPVASKSGKPLSDAAITSFTAAYVIPQVRKLFPTAQAMMIDNMNHIMESKTPSSTSGKKGTPLVNPFGAPTLQAISDQVQ